MHGVSIFQSRFFITSVEKGVDRSKVKVSVQGPSGDTPTSVVWTGSTAECKFSPLSVGKYTVSASSLPSVSESTRWVQVLSPWRRKVHGECKFSPLSVGKCTVSASSPPLVSESTR